jgi:hypothetical protein
MADATVREATPAEAARLAGWFPQSELAGLPAPEAARRFAQACADGATTLRVLVEGNDVLAAVCSRRVAALAGGTRVGVVLARGGAPESGGRNASVPILLRGVLRQYPGAAVACVTGGADPKALRKMGFASWGRAAVRVPARGLPRVPAGARLRPAFAVDLEGLARTRDAGAGAVAVVRTTADWERLLVRWRALAEAGARAPEAHVVLRGDQRIAYVVVQPGEGSLAVLEAAGDSAASAGAAGALARGRRLATVEGPAIPGLADAPGAAPVAGDDATLAARLSEDVDVSGVTADPLSAVDRL